ncbi:MAG: hypothetical protein K2N07_05955 [Desulfovibrio sp.]|nr:hypothetical protein [Desulfovibrio sp.]
MPFWNWLPGCSARATARELAELHRRCGGDYAEVMRLSMAALIMATAQGTVSQKNVIILEQVLSKSIRNYVDLGVLLLYVNWAWRRHSYVETFAEFSPEIRHWLLAEAVPHRYLDDDNRERTNTIVDTLREGLGLKGLFPDACPA